VRLFIVPSEGRLVVLEDGRARRLDRGVWLVICTAMVAYLLRYLPLRTFRE